MTYKIVQITDTHLTPAGAEPANNQQVDPADKLQAVFDDIYTTNVAPDLIVITGDLIHEGHAEDYQRFHDVLMAQQERLKAPIKVILGNHDRTKAFYEGYLKRPYQSRYYDKLATAGWDFYFLDTTCGNLEPGYLDQDQLTWLQTNLKQSAKPALLFMHHPLAGPPLRNMAYSILQNGDDLAKVIQGSTVKAIFSGHVHFANMYQVGGILNVVADSTAYHINCTNPHQHFVADATAYNVIYLDNQAVGVEQRPLRLGTKTINAFKIPNTDFWDPKLIVNEMNQVLS
ncbi:metallophosphoesterase family protein [Lentilactobacillus kisonensis]|uniref:Ser/Thr phosphatase family protein n=1 Tax=Lentilactobacillus kisonensis F0435 TaxID=797516 RepID=H1LKT7_9LACO|nr:metallophosphoesterase [Lentilactobacillus kisonensis]EHO46161.1 Ser/Thr phosphatase family protein [Lentilactobacillus kisonensis F0435]